MVYPIKTGDVVRTKVGKQKKQFVVKSVFVTDDGPVLELLPVENKPVIIHASEIELTDVGEKTKRIKSLKSV